MGYVKKAYAKAGTELKVRLPLPNSHVAARALGSRFYVQKAYDKASTELNVLSPPLRPSLTPLRGLEGGKIERQGRPIFHFQTPVPILWVLVRGLLPS